MKTKLFLIAFLLLVSAMVLTTSKETYAQDEGYLQVTVYQQYGIGTQAGAEVAVYYSNGNQWGLPKRTNEDGVVAWAPPPPYGTYTIKAWYPPRPNDGQFGQTTVVVNSSITITSVTLGPNY